MQKQDINFSEHDIMLDAAMSQDYIAGEYNHALLSSVTPQIAKAFQAVLADEQEIKNDVCDILISRGWLKENNAEKSEVFKTKENFMKKSK